MSECKRIYFWIGLVLILLIQAFTPGFNQEKIDPWDSNGPIEYRKPPEREINELKNNPAYNYDGKIDKLGFIQRILLRLLERIITGMGERSWLIYIIGGAVILVILFLILRFLNIPMSGFFSFVKSNKVTGLDLSHPVEIISIDELGKMFQLYKNNRAFRDAVRILYLMYLKKMSQVGTIRLRLNKSNKDYAGEIKDEITRKDFKRLSRLYDYVWFGQFTLADQEFYHIEKEYKEVGIPTQLITSAND